MTEEKTAEEMAEEIPAEETEKPEEAAEGEEPEKEQKHGKHSGKKDALKEKDAEIEALKQKIEELEGNVSELKNAYARAYADTENIKKRLNAEFEQRDKYKIRDFAAEILPVLDNCERALAIEVKDDTDANYRKGFEMVYRQLLNALNREGVQEIEALNQPFDPNWHQAMLSEHCDGVEPGMNLQVLQKGYKLKDRLLRAAMVKVSE